jgi:actin-like ATPase involved in cell morphogenesis
MVYALGIDIGTTYTAAAVYRDGQAATVPLGDRAHSVPSSLFLREDGVMLVGEAANRRGTTDPSRVAREFKRRLGDQAPLLVGETEMSAQQLTGYLIRWVVDKVTEREGERPAHVTLTCPATWGAYRRQLMTEAASTARLTDVGLLPEPVAAAAYYTSRERLEPGSLVAVYDLGGGTFDATVVRKTVDGFEIHGPAGGDETIGGSDFDQVVMNHVATTTGLKWSVFDAGDPTVLAGLAQLRAHATDAKEALSTDVEATVPVILPDVTREVRITRAELEAAIRIPVLRTVDMLAQTLAASGVEPADLRAVLLVGGSSRIPLISRLIAAEIGVPVAVDTHPKHAVCLGAAISAGSRLAASPPAPRSAAREGGVGTELVAPGRAPTIDPPPTSPARSMVELPILGTPTVEVPSAGAAGAVDATVDSGAELLAPPSTVPVVRVDLAGAGLDAPLDMLLAPAPAPGRPLPRLTGRDDVLTVTHTGDLRRGGRTLLAVLAGAAVVLVTAVVVGLATRDEDGPAPPAPPAPPGESDRPSATPAAGPEPAAGPQATLRDQQVPDQPGDVMHAVTALPGGDLVAVGASTTEGVPRAWRYRSGRWEAVPGLDGPPDQRGEMTGVASGGAAGLVAVGWVGDRTAQDPTGAGRRPAIWTSTDGASWRAAPSPESVGSSSAGLGELFDVAARPGGGFVAVGVEWGADPESGDGAVLTSPDGSNWQRVAAESLGGPGPVSLRRLLPAGSGFVAVGTRLDGAMSRPVMWTSPDATTWTVTGDLDSTGPVTAAARGLARTGDGRLLVTGFSVEPGGFATPALWVGQFPSSMRPHPITAGAARIFGVVQAGERIVAVGALTPPGEDEAAAAWTVQLP